MTTDRTANSTANIFFIEFSPLALVSVRKCAETGKILHLVSFFLKKPRETAVCRTGTGEKSGEAPERPSAALTKIPFRDKI